MHPARDQLPWQGSADRRNVLAALFLALPGSLFLQRPTLRSSIGAVGFKDDSRMRIDKETPPILHSRAGIVTAIGRRADSRVEKFHAWLESNGASLTGVKVEEFEAFGYGLISKGVKAGEELLTSPASLRISTSSVKKSLVGLGFAPTVPLDDDDSAFLALGLLQEVAKREKSAFAPYIDLLPGLEEMFALPLVWPDEDLDKYFAGSHLQEFVGGERDFILQQWEDIENNVLPKHPESLFPKDVFNERGYLWAHAVCLTRAIPFRDDRSLVPLLDIANHISGASNRCSIDDITEKSSSSAQEDGTQLVTTEDATDLEGTNSKFVITAGEDIPEGSQVFIDYDKFGSRSSWEMLYTYGLVSEQSECTARGERPMFFNGLSRDDPFFRQKNAVLIGLDLDDDAWEGTWTEITTKAENCTRMAPLLRLAHFSPTRPSMSPEITALGEKLVANSVEPLEVLEALQSPLDVETENLVAQQILSQCEEALSQLASESELLVPAALDFADIENADQLRAKLAAQVLLAERKALETCIGEWKARLTKPQRRRI